jgi:hypothetical protein
MFNKTSREQQKGGFFVVTYKHATRLFYFVYDFGFNILMLKSNT